MAFQFGGSTNQPTTQPGTTGFALPQPQQQQAKGFSYVPPASTGAFNFGTSATTASPGFSFGAPAAPAPTASPAPTVLGFGAPANASSTPGFTFGTQQPAAPSTGFAFGQPAATPAATSTGLGGFGPPSTGGFGQPAPATTAATTGFLFGVPNTSVSNTGFNFSSPSTGTAATATTTAATGIGGFTLNAAPAPTFGGFGAPAATTASGNTNAFGFGVTSSAAPTSTSSGFSLINTQPSGGSAFNFGVPKTTAPGIGFGMPNTAASSTAVASNAPSNLAFTGAAPSFGATGFPFTPTTKPAPTAATTTGLMFGVAPVTTVGSSIFSTGQMTSASVVNPPGPFNQGAPAVATTSASTISTLVSNLAPSSTAASGFPLPTTSVTSFCNVPSQSVLSSAGFMTSEAPKTSAIPFSTVPTPSSFSTGMTFGPIPTTTVPNTAVIKPTTVSFPAPSTTAVAPAVTSAPLPTSQADQAKAPPLTSTVPTAITSSVTPGFGFPSSVPAATTSTVTTGFTPSVGSGIKAPATTTTTGPSLLSTSIPFSSAPSTFSGFGITAPVSLSTATTVTASSAAGAALTTTTTVTPASAAPPATMNFRQLEDTINKWKIELEEQERVFLNQATQVNAWDRLLISNGEKITELNEAVERVKLDQQRLDHELDFILAQQRELEELLVPLEKSVESTPNIHHQQHADLEREHTYRLAENIDAQLKRMSEDIKEIIEHLNSSNKTQDDNDPIQQIAKILNAHMDALQWVDQNTANLRRKLDETSKLYESHRRDHEKSFRVGFS